MKLVLVEWVDSHASRGWVTPEQVERAAEPLYCRSVGWLLHDRRDCKVIVPHLAGEKNGGMTQVRGDLAIPTRAVIKMTVLKR